jgi:haloalkane dehalogenase
MPTLDVLDSTMYYEDSGHGAAFVFIHGNPTSSYVWRNVLPGIGPGRLLAPDLIGMGRSGKPQIGYQFADQARYLDAWFDAMDLGSVVLAGHDWGGSLALDWAARHPGRVRGVAFMETIIKPMAWADFAPAAQDRFRAMRTPGIGEKIVLEQNASLEAGLTGAIMTGLSEKDHEIYRQPFPTPESRRPLLQWPRSMPLDGEPADVVARVEAYDTWLAASADVPKLLLTFDPNPALMVTPEIIAWRQASITCLTITGCGPAGHQVLEDQPAAIAAAISGWATANNLR